MATVHRPRHEVPIDELAALSRRYASTADRRDVPGFIAVFSPDATLRVQRPGAVARTMRGHDELAGVPRRLERYTSTFHLLGQMSFELVDDDAVGEVHCVAHHLLQSPVDDAASTMVMYIRYADRYQRDEDGSWLIHDRAVQVDWTETRPVELPVPDRNDATRG